MGSVSVPGGWVKGTGVGQIPWGESWGWCRWGYIVACVGVGRAPLCISCYMNAVAMVLFTLDTAFLLERGGISEVKIRPLCAVTAWFSCAILGCYMNAGEIHSCPSHLWGYKVVQN